MRLRVAVTFGAIQAATVFYSTAVFFERYRNPSSVDASGLLFGVQFLEAD
jgi:hypothetical protein